MAQVLNKASSQAQAPQASTTQSVSLTSKVGRKSEFTSDEDLVIAQAVFVADSHVAKNGELLNGFEAAARKLGENPHFIPQMSGKNHQDRFKS